jgi:plasmid maintenance system antidote protein VapI
MRKPAPPAPPENPVSVGGLAKRLGVPRQRVYDLVRRGQVKAEPIGGALVITPEEATRVIEAATRIDTRMGSRLVFDFV